MARKPKVTSRGALLVVDLETADRAWSALPAREVLAGIRAGTLVPRRPSASPPFPPGPAKSQGLDVALRAFTVRRLLDRPLVENLRARRALGAPWRWFSRAPDANEEARTDGRLLRWAEISRVPDVTADEVMALSSAVEREMIGAGEVKDAFARWGTPAFAERLDALRDAELRSALEESWGDLAPLLAAVGHDDEDSLLAALSGRLAQVRAALRFARTERYAVLPWLEERWGEYLAGRAAARAR